MVNPLLLSLPYFISLRVFGFMAQFLVLVPVNLIFSVAHLSFVANLRATRYQSGVSRAGGCRLICDSRLVVSGLVSVLWPCFPLSCGWFELLNLFRGLCCLISYDLPLVPCLGHGKDGRTYYFWMFTSLSPPLHELQIQEVWQPDTTYAWNSLRNQYLLGSDPLPSASRRTSGDLHLQLVVTLQLLGQENLPRMLNIFTKMLFNYFCLSF